MFNKFTGLTALALIFSVNALAQDVLAPQEEPVSSDTILQNKTIAHKEAIMKDVNRHIYKTKDNELREFVRNSNAMKKIIDPDAKVETVNIKDKKAVSQFMQNEIGLPDKIVPEQTAENNKDKIYKSRASQDLQ